MKTEVSTVTFLPLPKRFHHAMGLGCNKGKEWRFMGVLPLKTGQVGGSLTVVKAPRIQPPSQAGD